MLTVQHVIVDKCNKFNVISDMTTVRLMYCINFSFIWY